MGETHEILHKEKLENCINDLRDVLNEMCCSLDEGEANIEKLTVSRQLDTQGDINNVKT